LGSRLAFDLTDSASLNADRAIDKLVLSSSDMDYHMALQKKESLESITRDMVYVMVSDRDGPLITSQLLHGSPRLGRPFDLPRTAKLQPPNNPSGKEFCKRQSISWHRTATVRVLRRSANGSRTAIRKRVNSVIAAVFMM
ncbi:MAG TPA: hypothetical protein PKC98_10590, partial [Candidatus Melainabacteria bacterium]|nr:hypothetical protein [Candidatus Melainabacteria bacterium]